MDDAEKTRQVNGDKAPAFDPDKTWVVPSTPRPATAGADAERTQVVNDIPAGPGRPSPTGEGQYPPAQAHIQYPSTGSNVQRSPQPSSTQNPETGPAPQRPQPTPPRAQHGNQAGPESPLPNYGPPAGSAAQQYPPSNYRAPAGGPPPSAPYGPGPGGAAPDFGPGSQPPHGYTPQPDPYAQQDLYGAADPYAQQQYQQPPQAGPYPAPPGQVQSPLQAANSALAKGGSFISRLIQRGMYGELIKNPWFQQTRVQNPDQFVYLSFGVGVILSLIVGQLPGVLGAVFTLALWAGIAYTFFAIGTKKAVQWVAYGICGVGFLLNAGGAVLGLLAWSSLNSSPYMSGMATSSVTTMLLVEVVLGVVCAALFAWVGITVHRTIKKLSGQG